MKYYYAVFKKSKEAVEVSFPDLKGCVTCGIDMDEAYENAVDVLAGWLAHAEKKFIKKPSHRNQLESCIGEKIPIPVDERIKESYEELKRFNVIFPKSVLAKLDDFRKRKKMKRSAVLLEATEKYLQAVLGPDSK